MSLGYYAGLLSYRSRIEAFEAAIAAAVRDGDRVVDLGTGLGTFAHFAVRAGARRVWAVDSDPVVHVARTVARANGIDDRIEFLRGRIPELQLPEPIDVLVFEDFPSRLLDDRTFRLLDDLGERCLAPDARTVPLGARLRLAPVRSSRLRSRLFPLDREPDREDDRSDGDAYGIDWAAVRPYLANQPRGEFLPSDALPAEPASGPHLALIPPPRAEALAVEGRWVLSGGGPVHALALWFELEVREGLWITNGPGPDTQPWGQVVLPLDPPVPVPENGTLEARVAPEAFRDGAPGWLTW
ncbi:MAG: hypothetical protein GWM92_03435, partial [Gemmatimonadetes bacterium]|nr:hypothetical protein [Gemmatimonadota bacterium]NIR79252.1 hypothetical protein [Gemmatimonadota bacterium]NIT86107.1 hypothetical protein [Gemmatimonadota bacterium]NIU31772.1 hypothetical protein [Gemmatimonadota bacterium]NIU36382.1 hypothetical protein [Gemmatimonadota bacterium]